MKVLILLAALGASEIRERPPDPNVHVFSVVVGGREVAYVEEGTRGKLCLSAGCERYALCSEGWRIVPDYCETAGGEYKDKCRAEMHLECGITKVNWPNIQVIQ